MNIAKMQAYGSRVSLMEIMRIRYRKTFAHCYLPMFKYIAYQFLT